MTKKKANIPIIILLMIAATAVVTISLAIVKLGISRKPVANSQPITVNTSKMSSPRPTATPKATPTSTPRLATIEGWKVYQNPKAGVSFEYPGDWMIEEEDNQSPDDRVPNNPFIISVSPKFEYDENGGGIPPTFPSLGIITSSLSFTESIEQDLFHNGAKISRRVVGNIEGYSYDLSRKLYEEPRPYRIGRVIVAPLNKERSRTASIGLFGEQRSAKETYSPDAKKNLELLEKIVSTVKFE